MCNLWLHFFFDYLKSTFVFNSWLKLVGLAFEIHDSVKYHRNLEKMSDRTEELKNKYQSIKPSFYDTLTYSFCYIGLLTGTIVLLILFYQVAINMLLVSTGCQ